MEYERGKHPNSLKSIKEHGFKPGESGNPMGRPPGKTDIALLSPLIRVIDDQQHRIERQRSQISEYLKRLNKAEAELTEAWELIEQLNEEPSQHNLCEECSKDIYEQQQNYERIKQELFNENEELKKENKELRWNLDCCQAREKDDWSWRERALKREKDLAEMEKNLSFQKRCHENAKAMCETLHEELDIKTQRIDKLLDELKPYREAKMQEIKGRIGIENAGRSRR